MREIDSVLSRVLGFDPYAKIQESGRINLSDLYYSFQIAPSRRNGKYREILAPCDELKTVQKAILKRILADVEPHSAATAYYSGRSIATNARQHLGCSYLYKSDVNDFFPSIKTNLVQAMLDQHFPHLSQPAVDEIIRLTTYNDSLPQGAPTSPHLANLALYQFDERISMLCDRIGARYTRYADDIAVSSKDMEALQIVHSSVRSGLVELGLSLHQKKTRFIGPNSRKVVTGLDVSGETVRPPRVYRKRAAALVRMCEVYPHRVTAKNFLRIKGYLLHWQGVSPDDRDLKDLNIRLDKIKPQSDPNLGSRDWESSNIYSQYDHDFELPF